jgi:hypothetical protein
MAAVLGLRTVKSLAYLLIVGLFLAGCVNEYPCANPVTLEGYDGVNCFVDPAITMSEGSILEDPTEGYDPYLEIGIYEEQLYERLEEGGYCPIREQSQGGVWAMPALRTQGISSPSKVSCTLVTDSGEAVSDVKLKIKMYLHDGFLQFQQLPLQIRDADKTEDVTDLFGVPVLLECTAEDSSGRMASDAVKLVFIEG